MLTKLFMLLLKTLVASVGGRMAGGGVWANLLNKKGAVDDDGKDLGGIMPVNLTFLPELFLAFGYAMVTISTTGQVFEFLSVVGWFYLLFQAGHADGYHMGAVKDFIRDNTLTKPAMFITGFFQDEVDRDSLLYDSIFMSLKGFGLVLLPAILTGSFLIFLSGIFFPIGYYLGWNKMYDKFWIKGAGWSEVISTGGVFLMALLSQL